MLTSDVPSGMDTVLRSLWNFTLIRKNDAGSTVRQGHTLVWLCGCYRGEGLCDWYRVRSLCYWYRVRGCVIGTG
jgi:hypothetical protein